MRFFVGNTDKAWYDFLSKGSHESINFWRPGGTTNFKALEPGAAFLLRLKAPINAVAGVGFFAHHTFLPLRTTWDVFGTSNGCDTYDQLARMIAAYRQSGEINPTVGCTVLTDPVFFDRADWFEIPDWKANIVQGKGYGTNDAIGRHIWQMLADRLAAHEFMQREQPKSGFDILPGTPLAEYSEVFTRVRVGQSAFRSMVTDAYQKRCSVSGERTLPVLEAAHIKPYAQSGPHSVHNGLLLRSDIHKLFDTGYITISDDYHVEVSQRIREEFENGKDYYRHHGRLLTVLPESKLQQPAASFLQWHNEHVFVG